MPIAAKRLTEAVARALPAPASAYAIHWCPDQPGFGCRVTSSGIKAWVVEGRIDGRTKRRTLGRAVTGRNAISADQARKLAGAAIGNFPLGLDHVENERAKRRERAAEAKKAKADAAASITFGEALTAYVRDKRSSKGRPLTPRTASDYQKMVGPATPTRIAGELQPLAARPLNRIDVGDVLKLRTALLKRGEGKRRAHYAMSVLRAVLRFHGVANAAFSELTPEAQRVKVAPTTPAVHDLTPKQVAAIWKTAGTVPNGDVLRFVLLTGLRRGEAEKVAVGNFDATTRTLAVPETKNHATHVVRLSRQAFAIAKARAAKRPKDARLFPSIQWDTIQAIEAKTGIDFSVHDLRSAFGSLAAVLVGEYVLRSMMNHSRSSNGANGNDVTWAHYVRIADDPLRAGWQTVADALDPPKRKAKKA